MALTSATLAGCGQDVQFSDSIDLEFDLLRQGDQLHTPYVVGADFSLCADSAREGELAGMRLRSGDPDRLSVGVTDANDDEDQICATVQALEVGEVEVEVVDDDEVVASVVVEIRAPDRVELLAAGPMLADRPDLDPQVEQPKILDGGTATFLVHYFDGEARLYGQGALEVESTDALSAQPVGTVFFEDREWLRISANEEGIASLELATPAGVFAELMVEVVGEDAIADVALHGSDERDREDGDSMVVYAQAYDEDDGYVFGVEYEWSLGGDTEPGAGDLFRYDYDSSRREQLVARHGDLDAAAEIHAGEGYVDSSNELGCSMGGRSGGAWGLLMLLTAGLGRRARRRNRAQ